MAEDYIKLFEEFPPVTGEAWKEKLIADLKGADFDRRLVWKTNEGFTVQPYYRREDSEAIKYLNALPGQFPYVRGTRQEGNDWKIRQDIVVDDMATANAKALNAIDKGASSLGFVISTCREMTTEDLETLLKGICLTSIEVNFTGHCCVGKLIDAFGQLVSNNELDAKKIIASVSHDPFGNYLLRGRFKHGLDKALNCLKKTVERAASMPRFRVIAVNGKNYGNAGASTVQELAFSLAQGAEYLSLLTEQGVSVDDVAKNIKFNFSVGPNYFMEIAGFRAGRLLWAQIVKAFGPQCDCSCEMKVHAETSSWNMTVYDPCVNMLRSQTEAMSAALGGVDSLTVQPFNAACEKPTSFSERIARNQQLLLKEESNFDKVTDPSAGSYYIEQLTSSIAEEAWKLFLAIQEKGGFLAAAKEGFIQTRIREMAAKRDLNIATRRENLLGTNQFPNFTETLPERLHDTSLLGHVDLTADDAEIETIKTYRGAQAFEKLRTATDRYAKDHRRPLAFMLTTGNVAMRKAREQFSCNFFAVAGFAVKENNGFNTVEEGVEAAKLAGADIIVLCSSDEEYAELAPATYTLVKDSAILVVAGAPPCMDELKAKGIEHFINVKSNLLEELKNYLRLLNIA